MTYGMVPPTTQYWATEPDLRKLGQRLKEARDTSKDSAQSSGRVNMWQRATALYFGLDPDTWRNSITPTFGGSNGEIVNIRGNAYRAFCRQVVTQVTGSRLAYQARPIAYDAESTDIVTVCNAWCDQLLDDHAEAQMHSAVDTCYRLGEAWVSSLWDPMLGKPIGTDENGMQIRTGDIDIRMYRPDEIVRDPDVTGGEHQWIGVLRQRNRWDLLAMFPMHSKAILGCEQVQTTDIYRQIGFGRGRTAQSQQQGGSGYADQVVVMEWYHRPCPALPEGRVTWTIDETVLVDGPSKYEDIPIYPMIVSHEPTGAYGYGDGVDLMGLQQIRDSVLTQITTTRENFGLRNVVCQPGSKVEPELVSMGMRLIEVTGPIQSLDLEGDATAQGAQALQLITSEMQMITGLNDAALGNAGKSTSGAALMVQAQTALQFNGALQRAYAGMFEQVMSSAIRCLRTFSTAEHVIHVVGKNREGVARRFMAADFNAIDGVRAEVGNPAMRSVGMRYDIAEKLLNAKVLPSADAFLEMVATGRTEPALEPARLLEAQIERENELLAKGQPVQTAPTDHHAEHIRQHAMVLDDPEVRANEQVAAAVTAHLQEHANTWAQMSMNPMGVSILAATGQQPSPAAAMMQAQQMAQAQAVAAQAGQGPQPTQAPQEPAQEPPNPEANAPQQERPQMPKEASGGPMPAGGPDMPRAPVNAPPPMGG